MAGYEAKRALYDERLLMASLGKESGEHLDVTTRRIERAAEPLVRAMLFAKTPPLQAPLTGTSDFSTQFQSRGPKDEQGRSLRDLDLQERLFRYPLSFLIYSESFDALPEPTLDYVYRRLREVLEGNESDGDFSHLTPSDRAAILEILEATKPGFTTP